MTNLPSIVSVCVTYARTAELESAIACFLAQKYDGEKHMVILNTFARQTLNFTHSEVSIINMDTRPRSLGEARNIAIGWAECHAGPDALIVVADDDDGATSWHLDNYGKNCEHDMDWVWLDREFYFEAHRPKSIAMGTPNTLAFRIRALNAIGGYPSKTVGEDRAILTPLTSQFKGNRVTLQPSQVSFCRNWDTGAYHISGEGDDKAGKQPAHDRLADWVDAQVNIGKIPIGEINLVPKIACDYDALARNFTGAVQKVQNAKQGRVGIIELGRHGDILNILPVCKAIAERHEKPLFFVSKEFSLTLEGVSYVEPVILDLAYDKVREAQKFAAHKVEICLTAQVWGDQHSTEKRRTYNADSFTEAGFGHIFDDVQNHPLIIDQRNPEREQALCDRVLKSDKPVILVNVKGGISSPYPPGEQFFKFFKSNWELSYDIVDMSTVHAERIYDLLGLFERAKLLITTDTSTLHLAAASTIPVVALVNDVEWLATAPRCNCIYRVRYSEALPNLNIINMLVANMPKHTEPPKPLPPYVKPVRKIIHCVERHPERDPATKARKEKAWKSWEVLYQQGVIPAHYENYVRDARSIGDPRDLPYLKDVLAHGMAMAGEDDIICFTNDDNILHPDLPKALRLFVDLFEAGTSQRREFHGAYPDEPATPEMIVLQSGHHMGRDLAFFSKRWLMAHWDELPDFILGSPVFDLCLAAMVRKSKGFGTTRQNIEIHNPVCELSLGYVSHLAHDPVWNALPLSTPSTAHNHKCFETWAKVYAPEVKTPL